MLDIEVSTRVCIHSSRPIYPAGFPALNTSRSFSAAQKGFLNQYERIDAIEVEKVATMKDELFMSGTNARKQVSVTLITCGCQSIFVN